MTNIIENLASNYFDKTSDLYDDDFSEESIWSLAHDLGKDFLEKYLQGSSDLVIADIGCGTGKWSIFFKSRAKKIILSDISENMLSIAKNKIDISHEAIVASVDNLKGIESESCDLVLCMGDPLSYVDDYVSGISELQRITKKGGYIFVSVDSRLGYLRILKEVHNSDINCIQDFMDTGNIVGWEGLKIHAFTEDELSKIFSEYGCSTIKTFTSPTVSSFFLFDENFKKQLKNKESRKKIIEIEKNFFGSASPGPHHLYGLFKKLG